MAVIYEKLLYRWLADDSDLPESLRKRLDLYRKAHELRGRGMGYSEIGEELRVSSDTIGRWIRGEMPKRVSRYEPDLKPSADLAYVAGFYLGDGKEAGEEHKVRFGLADREQLEYVGGLVAKILGRAPKPCGRDGPFYIVDYDSVVLSNFLNQEVKVLVSYLREFVKEFLQGFFDAEGYASCHVDVRHRRVGNFQVGIANTNLEYIQTVTSLLATFGLAGRRRRTNKRGQTMTIRGRTWIRRNDVYHATLNSMPKVLKFKENIGFRNRAKSEKLNDLVCAMQLKPSERYGWFTARYEREGRKWTKIDKTG